MNLATDQGIILAAGLGTRLAWLTHKTPKALMPIAGTAVIIRVIRRMVAAGVRHIAINVHHHAALLQSTLGDGRQFGVSLYYSVEPRLLDSGGGARQALLCLPSIAPVLIHNADIVSTIDLRALQYQQGSCALAMVQNPAHHLAGDFSLSDVWVGNHGTRYTFAGVSYWQPEVILSAKPNRPLPLLDLIHSQMDAKRCAGILHLGAWFDIGRPVDWVQASRLMAMLE